MNNHQHDNLAEQLSILGKNAQLSLTSRQKVRDQLFKKIGQLDLVDAVQTNTEVPGLIMPLAALLSIFKPRRVSFGIAATSGIAMGLAALTFATGALAGNAEPGSGVFYTVRRALETAQVALVSNPEKKAELKLSFATDRLQSLATTNPESLQEALDESKKALAEAQQAVSSPRVKSSAKDDLNTKLATIIGNQKTLLTTIIKDNLTNDSVKEGILAFRDELDQLIPNEETVVTVVVKVPSEVTSEAKPTPQQPVSNNNPQGTLITAGGLPAINTGRMVITITNVNISTLSQFVGSSRTEVYGQVTGSTVNADRIFIDSKLVWETPGKINNNLPWVEGDQNNHLVNQSN